jgi:hypothetical protein
MGLLRDLFSSDDGRPQRLLPRDAPVILESFGRFNGPVAGGDAGPGIELGRAIKSQLELEPDRVLDEMVEACDSIGGWSYHGAWDILSAFVPERQDDPRYVHIVDGLLDNLTEEGFGPGDIPMILTPRAIERQRAARAAEPEAPSAADPEPEIPPLGDGERRLLQVVKRPDGNENRIYLLRSRPGDEGDRHFVAVIHFSEADDFDFDTEDAWHGGLDERAVYIRVAESYANSRTATCEYWLEPNLQWFADRVG